jgi:cytochrome c551/c552
MKTQLVVLRTLAALLTLTSLIGCSHQSKETAAAQTGGDPDRGEAVITRYGCGGCHTIPGIRSATALVAPSLEHMANRTYIAGVMKNTPANLVRWIINPPAVDEKTAMPRLGLSEDEARDAAAYVYTLR